MALFSCMYECIMGRTLDLPSVLELTPCKYKRVYFYFGVQKKLLFIYLFILFLFLFFGADLTFILRPIWLEIVAHYGQVILGISQHPHVQRISNSSEKQQHFLRTTRRTFLASLPISHAVVLESRKWLGQGSHIWFLIYSKRYNTFSGHVEEQVW